MSHPPREPNGPAWRRWSMHSEAEVFSTHCVSLCLRLTSLSPLARAHSTQLLFWLGVGALRGWGVSPHCSLMPPSSPVPRAFLVSPRHPLRPASPVALEPGSTILTMPSPVKASPDACGPQLAPRASAAAPALGAAPVPSSPSAQGCALPSWLTLAPRPASAQSPRLPPLPGPPAPRPSPSSGPQVASTSTSSTSRVPIVVRSSHRTAARSPLACPQGQWTPSAAAQPVSQAD